MGQRTVVRRTFLPTAMVGLLVLLALPTVSHAATNDPTMSVTPMYRSQQGQLNASGLTPGAAYELASSEVQFATTAATATNTGQIVMAVQMPLDVPVSVTSVDVTLTASGASTPELTAHALVRPPKFVFLGDSETCPGTRTEVGFVGFPPGTYDFSGAGITFEPSRDTFDATGNPSTMVARIDDDVTGTLHATATVTGSDTVAGELTEPVASGYGSDYSIGQFATVTASCLHPGTSAVVSSSGPGVVLPPTTTIGADGTVTAALTLLPSSVPRAVTITISDTDGGTARIPVPIPSTTMRAGGTLSDSTVPPVSLLSPHQGYWLQEDYCRMAVSHVSQLHGVVSEPLVWYTDSSAPSGGLAGMPCRLDLLRNGNLVIYNRANRVIWQAGSQATGTANTLVMQDDGDLVERTAGGAAVWSSKYGRRMLTGGSQLARGQSLRVAGFALLLETNGNLVLFDNGHAVWATQTAGRGAIRVLMQHDGNLVLYNAAGHSVWQSHTTGKAPGGSLVLESGYLLIVTVARHIAWRS